MMTSPTDPSRADTPPGPQIRGLNLAQCLLVLSLFFALGALFSAGEADSSRDVALAILGGSFLIGGVLAATQGPGLTLQRVFWPTAPGHPSGQEGEA